MKKAIVLLSGGLDSSTVIKIAKNDGFQDIYALTFVYGQKNTFELDAAKRVAFENDVKEHKIVTIDLATFGGSSLTTNQEIESNRSFQEIGDGIPSTYVPARNTLFLTYALAWSEVLPCYDIYIGANNVDYSGYPDCRPEFFHQFEKMANLATKIGVEGKKISIRTPLISLRKHEIITLGIALGVDYSKTSTCYNPSMLGAACGQCDACTLRLQGFENAKLKDPIVYDTKLIIPS